MNFEKSKQKRCHSPARLWQTLCVYSMCCSAIRKTSYELVRVNSFSSPMYHSPSHSLQAPYRHHHQDQPTDYSTPLAATPSSKSTHPHSLPKPIETNQNKSSIQRLKLNMSENQKTMFIQYLPSSLAILSGTIENLLEPLESLLERCSPSHCLLRLLNSLPLSSPCFAFRRKTLEQGQGIKDFGEKSKP